MASMEHHLGEDIAPVSDEYDVVYLAWKHGVTEDRVRRILRLDEPPRPRRFLVQDRLVSRPAGAPRHFS